MAALVALEYCEECLELVEVGDLPPGVRVGVVFDAPPLVPSQPPVGVLEEVIEGLLLHVDRSVFAAVVVVV